ncbi:MAG: DNA polymerase III subunit delta [Thermodesulfovibrionales bacterium]
MSFQTFLNAAEKGLPAPVYMFYASDLFLLREAMDEIKRLVPEAERDFNFHILDLTMQGEDTITLEQILNVANTVSFFGGRRFTILSGNIQKLLKKDLERLHVYIANPAEGSVFVILHSGLLSKDAREKFKALKPVSLDMRESEIPFWIKKRAQIKGIEISDNAIDFLIGLHGPDLGLLASEIEKISLLGKENVNTDDISEIVTGGRLYSIFDLTNALRERDPGRVFRIYKTLRETSDDYSLIGALNWQYGRHIHSGGNQAENEYLLRVFELLNSVDKDIKSSGRIFPMEYLLIKLLRLQEGRLPSS